MQNYLLVIIFLLPIRVIGKYCVQQLALWVISILSFILILPMSGINICLNSDALSYESSETQ